MASPSGHQQSLLSDAGYTEPGLMSIPSPEVRRGPQKPIFADFATGGVTRNTTLPIEKNGLGLGASISSAKTMTLLALRRPSRFAILPRMRIWNSLILQGTLLLLPTMLRAELIDGIAAYVNEKVITVGDVEAAFTPHRARLHQLYKGEELTVRLRQAYRETLQVMVERQLIVTDYTRRVAKQELKIPDSVVEERVDSMVRRKLGVEKEAIMQALAREGITMDEFREPFRDRVIVSILRSIELGGKTQVSPQEIRSEYSANIESYKRPAKVKLSVVVMNLGEDEEGNARIRRKAEIIHADLRQGASFSNTAVVASQGRNAENGGDWGWYNISELRPELAEASVEVAVGAVSEIVQIDRALYMIRIDERVEAGVQDLPVVQPEIEARLMDRKAARLYDEWMQRLRDNGYVKIVAFGANTGADGSGVLSFPRD